MHDPTFEPGILGRRIGVRIGPASLAPRVLEALRALGYTMIDLDSERVPESARDACGLWLVDEDRLPELPSAEDSADRRILLIASARSAATADARNAATADARVFATTRRPARLGAVYEMIQSALESTPRSAPRIRTQLSARCIRGERRSIGAVLSLSEGGCLLRSGERMARGTRVALQFALPNFGLISTPAECRYARDGDAGLAFAQSGADVRHSISHYVTARLAESDLARRGAGSSGGALSA